MGSLCCCFHIKDPEDDVSNGQNSICLNCIICALWRKHFTAICNNEQLGPTSTAQVGADNTPLCSDAATTNVQSNTTTSPPMTLQFDSIAATCNTQKQAEGQIGEQENIQVMEMVHAGKGNKSEACELSEEDEDVCPICLEEYIPENPPIVLQCSHSYHLSCIYEWMERSVTCPACSQVMIFEEAA